MANPNMALLDLNYWFHKGAQESPEVYDMMCTGSDGSFGFVMWDDYTENDFLPNLFNPYSIFKLLFKDAVMLPKWVYDFKQEDVFVNLADSNGNILDVDISIDPTNGNLVITSQEAFTGSLLAIGKNDYIPLPQFYVRDIGNWTQNGDEYTITIPQTEHKFTGSNIIESLRTIDGDIVDVEMETDSSSNVTIRSNTTFEGRISLLGDVNQPNLWVHNYLETDWASVLDDEGVEHFEISIPRTEFPTLVSALDRLLVRTKNENNESIDTGVRIDNANSSIVIVSNYRLNIKVIIFDEQNFYLSIVDPSIWISDGSPYKIIIKPEAHGLFNVPSHINTHIRAITLFETGYIPKNLQVLLDTYYNIHQLWVVAEDPESMYPSILLDEEVEYEILDLLSQSKDYIYCGGTVVGAPADTKPLIMDKYYSHYQDLTPLQKSVCMEMYYLHYEEDDNWALLNHVIDQIPTYSTVTENKPYYLTTVLYSYMVINKIIKRRVTDNASFEYTPDYWANE